MVAFLQARGRRKSDEQEWEWTRVRAVVAAMGVELKPLNKAKAPAKAPSGTELDIKLAAWKSKGINVKDVPRS